MYIAALYTGGKVVTGCNHGEAFGKLTEDEKNSKLLHSGFLDQKSLKFITEDCEFYLKKLIMLRHGDSVGKWDSPISDLGRNQAKLAAAFLVTLNLKGYVGLCSPLRRCVETAKVMESVCGIKFMTNDYLLKQGDKESNEGFLDRVKTVLEHLPEKSVLVSHCDFIQVMTELASDAEAPDVVPNCSATYIDNHKAVFLARKCDELRNMPQGYEV
jgi:broad specificity phosphatase PhoE